MKSKLPLLLLLLPAAAPYVAASEPTRLSTDTSSPSPAVLLASQLEKIAASPTLTPKNQAKLVANTVRMAITAATDGINEPARRFEVALELTIAAVKAVPEFAATITAAALEVPAIAALDGAAEKIDAAVNIALENTESPEVANPVANPPRPPRAPEFGGPNKGETVVSPSA